VPSGPDDVDSVVALRERGVPAGNREDAGTFHDHFGAVHFFASTVCGN